MSLIINTATVTIFAHSLCDWCYRPGITARLNSKVGHSTDPVPCQPCALRSVEDICNIRLLCKRTLQCFVKSEFVVVQSITTNFQLINLVKPKSIKIAFEFSAKRHIHRILCPIEGCYT